MKGEIQSERAGANDNNKNRDDCQTPNKYEQVRPMP
jgi:hypothetical protein